jgi:hypothetical protein
LAVRFFGHLKSARRVTDVVTMLKVAMSVVIIGGILAFYFCDMLSPFLAAVGLKL